MLPFVASFAVIIFQELSAANGAKLSKNLSSRE
jgi:hypothetical protein